MSPVVTTTVRAQIDSAFAFLENETALMPPASEKPALTHALLMQHDQQLEQQDQEASSKLDTSMTLLEQAHPPPVPGRNPDNITHAPLPKV